MKRRSPLAMWVAGCYPLVSDDSCVSTEKLLLAKFQGKTALSRYASGSQARSSGEVVQRVVYWRLAAALGWLDCNMYLLYAECKVHV